MSKVFVSMDVSLDGCIEGPNATLQNMGGDGWGDLHAWVFSQRVFRQRLKIGEGGDTGPDNQFLAAIFERTGASIMGKRMFDLGEASWPEEAPFHTPVFVVTHEVRAPWVRPGGTTFFFVNEGIEPALQRAREVCGDKDIRISGGANLVVQYLNAGFVDELLLSVAPTLLGGKRLFDGIDARAVGLEITETLASPLVTHLRYAVKKKP
ncbi:MAG TPA: dihydrofolate reductase family protein [Polyangiaceae bacterium]|nr:dihydrofolate reductase family protein [Polyangiaceae bacterium]